MILVWVDRRWYGCCGVRDNRARGTGVHNMGTTRREIGRPDRRHFVRRSPFAGRVLVLPLVIVAFEAHETEITSTEKPCNGGEGVVMVLIIEPTQELVTMSVRGEQVGARGIATTTIL